MHRRSLLAGAAAAASLPRFAIGQPAGSRVLRFVPQANLTCIDPIWTTANITRNHGFMVYDTLYGLDASFRAAAADGGRPCGVEDEGRSVTITLRDGLRFHDGEPVRAADCVASINRWMKRNPIGQKLATVLDELTRVDDRRLRFRLKRPSRMLFAALAKPANPACFIMPERIAQTDPSSSSATRSAAAPSASSATSSISGASSSMSAIRTTCRARRQAEPDRRAARWRISTASNGASSPMRRPPPPRCSRARSTGTSSRRPTIQTLLRRNRTHRGRADRPAAADWHPALQPPAPALQRQADAPGAAAGDGPGRLHDGDRRRRSARCTAPGRHLHPRHAAGERCRPRSR